jgi:transcriptional regulator with XRE-family HTH domain
MKEDLDRRWHDLGEFIREQRNVGQMSLRKLSELAGVSNPYLSQIERGLRRPSAEILQQIARALEISSESLYVRAGILDEPGTGVDPVGEIRRDPALTEEQKKSLIGIYESFRRLNEADAAAGSGSDAGDEDGEKDAPEAPDDTGADAVAVPGAGNGTNGTNGTTVGAGNPSTSA